MIKNWKSYNEEVMHLSSNDYLQRMNAFFREYKKLFDFEEFEEGDEPSNVDILSDIGDLCLKYKLTKDDAKFVQSWYNTNFDVDNLLGAVIQDWKEEKDINDIISDMTKMFNGLSYHSQQEFLNNINAKKK